ncbi:MAG TPA: MotA/TolQ/ExbB proton channel family protein [Sphingomonas sp.]|jgi:chemotaxis protein MotA
MIDLFDPVAGVLVVGGTLITAVLRVPGGDVARAIVALSALPRRRFDAESLLHQIAAQARIAERHGVLQLDRAVIADSDVAAAMAAIVDGAPADQVGDLLRYRRRARAERHAAAAEVWAGAAEAAPAMGMIGTLIGLAGAFATMTDASAIGSAMAIALLATLYGALLANLVAAPIAARLRALARAEAFERARLEAPLVALAQRETPRLSRAA